MSGPGAVGGDCQGPWASVGSRLSHGSTGRWLKWISKWGGGGVWVREALGAGRWEVGDDWACAFVLLMFCMCARETVETCGTCGALRAFKEGVKIVVRLDLSIEKEDEVASGKQVTDTHKMGSSAEHLKRYKA